MHPPLYRPHPLCKSEVEALIQCHEEKKIGKFFNACGQIAEDLNKCFREEKILRKKLNSAAGRRTLGESSSSLPKAMEPPK